MPWRMCKEDLVLDIEMDYIDLMQCFIVYEVWQ